MSDDDLAQRIEARSWWIGWLWWQRRAEILHTRRRMFPDRYGWKWLYKDTR